MLEHTYIIMTKMRRVAKSMKVSEISSHVKGTLNLGPHPDREILAVAPVTQAGEQDLAFIDSKEYIPQILAAGSAFKAGALLLKSFHADLPCPQIIHPNPRFAFAVIASLLCRKVHPWSNGVSPRAFVDPTVTLGKNVTVGPFAFVGPDCRIGDDCVIYPHASLYHGVILGKSCVIHSHATLYQDTVLEDEVIVHAGVVIGADGFGYVRDAEVGVAKIPQVGNVQIHHNVEIGSLTNVDRGAMESTVIGAGTKIDSLAHIAHNVKIGKNCFICGQSGVAGSSTLGDCVTLAGQSGVADHVRVGDNITLGARGVIPSDLLEEGIYHGFPAVPSREFWRQQAVHKRLPRITEELATLKKKIAELEKKLS
jgi:UDP-3-O-[3-hydroxymyristoyl] glucosamine N-acyltransferase